MLSDDWIMGANGGWNSNPKFYSCMFSVPCYVLILKPRTELCFMNIILLFNLNLPHYDHPPNLMPPYVLRMMYLVQFSASMSAYLHYNWLRKAVNIFPSCTVCSECLTFIQFFKSNNRKIVNHIWVSIFQWKTWFCLWTL